MSMVLDFHEIRKEDVMTAGGKGANLGEMTAAGIAVPEGFVITADAYRAFLKANDLEGTFTEELGKAGRDEAKLLEAAKKFRELIGQGKLPEEAESAIRRKYAQLGGQVRVAVRSSATAEDLPEASFAGQQETYLNVRGIDEVLMKVRRCYASLWGNRAVCYRCNQGYDQLAVAFAVVIQRMVESEKAGVLFTVNPVTQNKEEMQINASYGLGESVVSGRVTADSYLCSRQGTVKSFQIGSKETQIIYADKDTNRDTNEETNKGTNKETKEIPVSARLQAARCLNDQEVAALCTEAVKVEKHYGCPMDIEWAICDSRVYILQARAVTTLGKDKGEEERSIAEYMKGSRIKGAAKENMSFQLEKMPYAYRPLDYDYMIAINTQKANIFKENGIVLTSDPKMDDDGIQTLPDSGMGINKNIFKLFGTLKLIRDYDKCAGECHAFMQRYEAEIEEIKGVDFDLRSIQECGEFISYSMKLIENLAYDRFKYALFPSVMAKDMEKAVRKVNKDYTKYDLFWGLDNKTSVVTRDIAALADKIRADDKLSKELLAGTKYEDLCGKFPYIKKEFDAFLRKNGYKSDYNCYCVHARTLIEAPDRLIHILQPLVADNGKDSVGAQEKDFGRLLEQLKNVYGSRYPALEKKIEHFRYFHVVREESQYLWETLFCYVRKCLKRANVLLLSDTDYESGVANLFAEELIQACKRGSLSESDREKIRRRNEKHPLAQKVWDASKLLVFDSKGDVLKGVSGSAGVAVGNVCVIHGPEEFYKMRKGDVLVCQLTDPEWTPLFGLASAVVADTGSALSHAAIVAREYGIPAVLGVGFATARFGDGDTVRVDGDRGEVYGC